eukprot:TRINITY_DN38177_c0_g1_i1.p2 TRINITY_DN38177_c0_g1~~TRINITY_DN38177_c0_g1_i1.p2  ORF type:complete len:346 (+),score=47.27 TRINITY_DN38177_c0_g1_i1:107-1144(+)
MAAGAAKGSVPQTPGELWLAMRAAVKQTRPGSRAELHAALRPLAAAAPRIPRRLWRGRDVSHALHALAGARFVAERPIEFLHSVALDLCDDTDFDVYHVTGTLWAVAVLRTAERHPQLSGKLVNRLRHPAIAGSLQLEQSAAALWALARLPPSSCGPYTEGQGAAAWQGAVSAVASAGAVALRARRHGPQNRMPRGKTQAAILLGAAACAKAGGGGPARKLCALSAADALSSADLREFAPAHIVAVVWALATAGPPDVAALLARIRHRVVECVDQMAVHQCNAVLWAFATTRTQAPEMYNVLCSASVPRHPPSPRHRQLSRRQGCRGGAVGLCGEPPHRGPAGDY